MPLCFSCITDLSFGTEIARETKRKRQSLQQCKFLTDNNIRPSLYRLHPFRQARTSKDYRSHDADKSIREAAWPSGQRVRLEIRRSRVRVPLWPLAGFVLGRPKFKSSATFVNSQLVASCQLGF